VLFLTGNATTGTVQVRGECARTDTLAIIIRSKAPTQAEMEAQIAEPSAPVRTGSQTPSHPAVGSPAAESTDKKGRESPELGEPETKGPKKGEKKPPRARRPRRLRMQISTRLSSRRRG
jgi:hypothetical protein